MHPFRLKARGRVRPGGLPVQQIEIALAFGDTRDKPAEITISFRGQRQRVSSAMRQDNRYLPGPRRPDPEIQGAVRPQGCAEVEPPVGTCVG
jgi:hypothetical protein